jgi:hypothetical protein
MCGDGTPFKGKFWASGKCKHCGKAKECHTTGSPKEEACTFNAIQLVPERKNTSEKKNEPNKENRKRSRESTDLDLDEAPESAKKKCNIQRFTDAAFSEAAKTAAKHSQNAPPTPVAWKRIDIEKTCASTQKGQNQAPALPPPPPLPRPDPATAKKLVRDGLKKLRQGTGTITVAELKLFFQKHDGSKLFGPCSGTFTTSSTRFCSVLAPTAYPAYTPIPPTPIALIELTGTEKMAAIEEMLEKMSQEELRGLLMDKYGEVPSPDEEECTEDEEQEEEEGHQPMLLTFGSPPPLPPLPALPAAPV